MTAPVDLFPTAYRKHEAELEAVCEYVERLGDAPFTRRMVAQGARVTVGHLKALGRDPRWGATGNTSAATEHMIRSFLALGFIERCGGGPAPRPVWFRVVPQALPKAVSA